MNECLSVVLCWITLLFVYRFSKYTIYFFYITLSHFDSVKTTHIKDNIDTLRVLTH